MDELPGDLMYTREHEWLRREDDGSVTIGITDHAQSALGDLVYVELPEVGQELDTGSDMAVGQGRVGCVVTDIRHSDRSQRGARR